MAESKVASLQGHEIEEDYVRTHLPVGRWGDTWNLFKSNFMKIVIINLLTLVFFVPGIALMYFRAAYISQMGLVYPFSSNPMFTYPITPSMQAVPENIVLSADLLFMSVLIVAGLIASVGISGACYSIRKLINTHGQFTVKGYFRGVKACYFNTALPVTVLLTFIFASFVVSDWAAVAIARGTAKAGPVTAQVFMIMATVIVGVYCCWLLAVGVSYKVKLKYLFKNSFVLLLGSVIQTLFMLAFAMLPVWFVLIGLAVPFFKIVGYAFFLFFGISFMILCWMAFAQYVFDAFITPAIKVEEEARKSKLTPKQLAQEKEAEEKAAARELLAAGRSELVARPMRPIEGGTEIKEIGVSYGRADIARVAEDRQKIAQEVTAYYDEHKGDTRYVEYEKLFAEREKALTTESGKKGKKKKLPTEGLLKK